MLAPMIGTADVATQASADSSAEPGAYVGGDERACLMCHGAASRFPAEDILDTVHAIRGNPASPFAQGGLHCEACHGPSESHLMVGADGVRPPPPVSFAADADPTAANATCLNCHGADVGHHWAGSAHEFEDVGCTSCHKVHEQPDPALSADGDEVCVACHRRERADLMRSSTHPLRAGLMNCADCHTPHGGSGPGMLTGLTVNETCYSCHAEKRGPFLWEHAPVLEDCTLCHRPHGSNHRDLLQTRTPMLCQQCHLAPFHPSAVSSGAGVPPTGADRQLLGRDCMNCHSRIHGSNHPSGAGLTR